MDLHHEDEQPSPKTLKSYNEVVHPISTAGPEPTFQQPSDTSKINHSDVSALQDNTKVESDQTLSVDMEKLNLNQSKLISDQSAPLDSQHVTTEPLNSQVLQQQTVEVQNSGFVDEAVNSKSDQFTHMAPIGQVESAMRK